MILTAGNTCYTDLNKMIKESPDTDIVLKDVLGQRYIGCGVVGKRIEVHGTPGNALGSYMNGGVVEIFGNAQDATGDTMNNGRIIIHGNCGDTTGYGMRGGIILVEGDAGYRVGIHMKEYRDLKPVIVIGGRTGDFLGEYQAGGIIIVLGMDSQGCAPVGSFCGTGMHGGAIYLRTGQAPDDLPVQVDVSCMAGEDAGLVRKYVHEYSSLFGRDEDRIMDSRFIKLTANTKNPYRQLYTRN